MTVVASRESLRALLTLPSVALFLSMFANQASLLVLSPILVELARDLDVSTAAAGQARTVSGLVAGVTALSIGALGRRLDLRDLLLGGLALLAGGSVVSAAAPTFLVLLVAQALLGAGLALVVSGAVAGAAEWSPPERRARVLSWALIGQAAAWIVGMPLIGLIAEVSWRLAWLALPVAACAVAAGAVVLCRQTTVNPAATAGLNVLAGDRTVALWAAGEMLAYCAWAGTLVYAGALFVESYGTSVAVTGLVLGGAAVAYVPGSLLFRRWVERAARPLLVGLALAAAGAAVAFGTARPSLAVSAGLFAVLAFVNGARTIAGSTFGLDAAPDQRLAVMGVRAAATQFGYLGGAALGGLALALGGYPALGWTLAALFALAAAPHVAALALDRR
jgi:predicted MFS family arabinose efflux permease